MKRRSAKCSSHVTSTIPSIAYENEQVRSNKCIRHMRLERNGKGENPFIFQNIT